MGFPSFSYDAALVAGRRDTPRCFFGGFGFNDKCLINCVIITVIKLVVWKVIAWKVIAWKVVVWKVVVWKVVWDVVWGLF